MDRRLLRSNLASSALLASALTAQSDWVEHSLPTHQGHNLQWLVRDAATGSYAIDQHNGIVLEARLLGDRLYSWFEVQGTELIVREQLMPGPDGALGWSFEILTSQGATVPTGDEIPVESTLPTGLQRAFLKRIPDGPHPD